jgi:hypothetical protein
MDWDQCCFARAVALVPQDVVDILTGQGNHVLLQRLRSFVVEKELSEAFATEAARDRALGRYGQVAQFVRMDWDEHLQAGFDFTDIAVGHAIGEEGFDRLAGALVDAHAQTITRSRRPREIVLARCRYFVAARHDGGVSVSAMSQFGVNRDDDEIAATMHWLHQAFVAQPTKSSPIRS